MIKARKRSSGFTLVELMIVVAIIGILAAIAIPAFSRYVKRSRTAEAVAHLNKLWAGSVSYYESDHMNPGNAYLPLPKQFAFNGANATEAADCCAGPGQKCPAGFKIDEMNYSLPDPHLYRPFYTSAGTGSGALFTARAIGDLNCDTVMATFERLGRIDPATRDVVGNAAPLITGELE